MKYLATFLRAYFTSKPIGGKIEVIAATPHEAAEELLKAMNNKQSTTNITIIQQNCGTIMNYDDFAIIQQQNTQQYFLFQYTETGWQPVKSEIGIEQFASTLQ